MGFFDLKVKCAICDNDVGLNRFQLTKNVWICPNCLKKLGGTAVFPILKKMNINEIKEKLNNTNEALSNFVITKKLEIISILMKKIKNGQFLKVCLRKR